MKPLTGGQDGFSLIEGMVAMVVLTVALLGLAGMQTMAMMSNVDTDELTRAGNLAAEMIERIQYNKQNITAYQNIDTTLVTPCPNAPGGTPETTTARGDCLQWQAQLTNSGLNPLQGMPSPQGQVTIVNPFGPVGLNQSQVLVTVRWQTKRGGGSDNIQRRARPAIVSMQTIVTPP